MKHLYYVRHGESKANVSDRFGSRPGAEMDQGLTELGREQALRDGKKAAAAGQQFDLILCSPLVRARETAEIIARQIGYPVDKIQIVDDLVELQFGELEGTPWNAWWEAGNSYSTLGNHPGAETIEALQQRAAKAYDSIRLLPEDDILVVGHSAFGRAFRRVINQQPYTDEFVNGTSLTHGEIIKLI